MSATQVPSRLRRHLLCLGWGGVPTSVSRLGQWSPLPRGVLALQSARTTGPTMPTSRPETANSFTTAPLGGVGARWTRILGPQLSETYPGTCAVCVRASPSR